MPYLVPAPHGYTVVDPHTNPPTLRQAAMHPTRLTPPGRLILINGAPGSGKSKLAATNYPGDNFARDWACWQVARDNGGNQDPAVKADADRLLEFIAARRLSRGLTVAIDTVGRSPAQRLALLAVAPPGTSTELVICDTPLQVCLDRNARRRPDHHVPADTVRNCHARIGQLLAAGPGPLHAEGWQKVTVVRYGPPTRRRRLAEYLWWPGLRRPAPPIPGRVETFRAGRDETPAAATGPGE